MKAKIYSKPALRAINVNTESNFMIPISGQTTPEAADAKASFFDGIIRDGYSPWK